MLLKTLGPASAFAIATIVPRHRHNFLSKIFNQISSGHQTFAHQPARPARERQIFRNNCSPSSLWPTRHLPTTHLDVSVFPLLPHPRSFMKFSTRKSFILLVHARRWVAATLYQTIPFSLCIHSLTHTHILTQGCRDGIWHGVVCVSSRWERFDLFSRFPTEQFFYDGLYTIYKIQNKCIFNFYKTNI